jgi:ABC-type branched-subunit amino acid transport system permease subunit
VILGVLVVSALIGAVNGAMVVRLRIHPLIATLISFNLLSGAALVYTTGPVGGIPSEMVAAMHERFLGLPYPVWVVVVLLVALGTMLTRTRFGRNAYAVGGDAEVARRAGVNADAVRFLMLVLCSMLAGAAGIVLAFRQGIGDPRVAQGLELESIVAVVIGGVSIFGGRGSLIGMLGGVVFLNILRNAMNLQGVDPAAAGRLRRPRHRGGGALHEEGGMSFRRLVGFGEAMLRMTVRDGGAIETTTSFDCSVGGAELNACIAAVRAGMPATWVSALPDDPLGRLVRRHVRANGVDAEILTVGQARLGLYVLEMAPQPRPLRITYDRKGSAFALLDPDRIEWRTLLGPDACLLLTGITPPLGSGPRKGVEDALAAAPEVGAIVALDVNYRSALWSRDEASRWLGNVLPRWTCLGRTDDLSAAGLEGE